MRQGLPICLWSVSTIISAWGEGYLEGVEGFRHVVAHEEIADEVIDDFQPSHMFRLVHSLFLQCFSRDYASPERALH
jgi:hypothetical protein